MRSLISTHRRLLGAKGKKGSIEIRIEINYYIVGSQSTVHAEKLSLSLSATVKIMTRIILQNEIDAIQFRFHSVRAQMEYSNMYFTIMIKQIGGQGVRLNLIETQIYTRFVPNGSIFNQQLIYCHYFAIESSMNPEKTINKNKNVQSVTRLE